MRRRKTWRNWNICRDIPLPQMTFAGNFREDLIGWEKAAPFANEKEQLGKLLHMGTDARELQIETDNRDEMETCRLESRSGNSRRAWIYLFSRLCSRDGSAIAAPWLIRKVGRARETDRINGPFTELFLACFSFRARLINPRERDASVIAFHWLLDNLLFQVLVLRRYSFHS